MSNDSSNKQSYELKYWEALKNGSAEALGFLYDIYADDLFAIGLSISGNRGLAKDCIHDVFIELYKYRKKLSTPNSVRAYLITAYKRKLKKQLGLQSLPKEISLFNTVQTESIEEVIIADEWICERNNRLLSAFNLLTKTQKQGINLRFNEDRTYEEIAEILNVSVESSRTIIYRGIKELRKNLIPILVIITLSGLL